MVESQNLIQSTIAYLHQQKLYGNELFFKKSFKNDQLINFKRWKNLNELETSVHSCKKCRLAQNGQSKIMGVGNLGSNLMLICDTPRIVENKDKESELLIKILAAIEFKPEEVYLSSILKCNPPNNRKPLNDEIASCIPFLIGQIELIEPKIILVLGQISGNVLFSNKKNMLELRSGNFYKFKNSYVYVTYHPAELVKSNDPDQKEKKRMVWEDLKKMRHMYDEIVGNKPKWQ